MFSGRRIKKVIVGLTDVLPDVQAPVAWNYDVCAKGPRRVLKGSTVYLMRHR